ncbi:hypothetical protein F5141DRAFT_1061652 [Pisolithus sp. B1]|nr:hypothetical protein F5141DRAFT_1061652 [Pisolithus sp. B1]
MVFQEGYFNDLLPQLPIQPNGHHKTAKNCHDKWESLKQEYYMVSTIAGGSGLAYSAEKGANVMTEVGQLVMDELIKTQPEAAQFQHKGFKFWDHINQFVPPNKYQTETPDQTQTMPTTQNVQCTMSGLEDKVQEFMTSFNNTSNRMVNRTLSTLDDTSKDQKLSNTCTLIYNLEKSLLADNFICLQMLFEENLSFITGYQHVATHLASLRMWWVKLRLKAAGYSVPEYAPELLPCTENSILYLHVTYSNKNALSMIMKDKPSIQWSSLKTSKVAFLLCQVQSIIFIKSIRIWYINIIRIMDVDNIMNAACGCRQSRLNHHAILRWKNKGAKMSFDDSEVVLNVILKHGVTKVKG